ncbi:MAG: AfsR/SARP family transcriptional regulator [Pyrinomonadaceae bacterium]
MRINPKTFSPSSLEIRLLGPFRIVVDGTAVDEVHWSRRKPQLLLQLLALQPHHQPHREEAMELLWPEHEPEAASNNLHKAIHLARRALEPELHTAADSHFIIKQGQQIVLRAPERLWVDVVAFEHAAAEAMKGEDAEPYTAALSLYSGDLLAEDLYEDWAATRREQLRSTYQELLLRVARLYETRGQYQPSIERFKELVPRDQSNEEVHRQLMRLYTLTGNKHQALRQYQLCCDALARQLDAEPDRATQQLHQQITSGQLAPPSGEVGGKRGSREVIETIDSLAILPFANASSDPNAENIYRRPTCHRCGTG